MIEIKISTATAANLLFQRMRGEFEYRKKLGLFSEDYDLYNISFDNLMEITNAAIFDLIILLPAEIFLKENNLATVITAAVRSLSKDLRREEFILYEQENAESIMNSICRLFHKADEEKTFLNN